MICNKIAECYDCVLLQEKINQCTNNIDECIVYSDNRTNAKCEEHKKKYMIHNKNKILITLYRIDGGAIIVDGTVPPNQRKCDFLFCVNAYDTAVLVELKGTAVATALEQVVQTYKLFSGFLAKFNKVNCRIIVTNSTPKLFANPLYVQLEKLIKSKNGDINIIENEYIEDI